MKVSTRRLSRSHWLAMPLNSGPYRKWLVDKGSLTRRLQNVSSNFAVHPVIAGRHKPLPDESEMLGLQPRQRTLIREVYLFCNHEPVVFAHSVLPYKSLRGAWARLGKLGSKPLGAMLFSNPGVSRTRLEFKKLSRQHPLHRRAVADLEIESGELWARRSVFFLKNSSILVTEIFLPQVTSL